MIRFNHAISLALVLGLAFASPATGVATLDLPDVPEPKIVGGTEVPAGAYPFMAALVWSGVPNAKIGLRCGAVMLDTEWILTAAHCTFGHHAGEFDIVVGRDTLTSTDGERIGVAEIHEHADFNSLTFENDIALLKLENPATAGEPIQWVIEEQDDLFAAGTLATTIGWGITESDPAETGSGTQDTLREVDVQIRSANKCSDAYPGEFFEGVMICAGYALGGKDSCSGDSGGPLIVSTETGMAEVGVVSWGYGCADPGDYGVYTRTASFSDWILEVTGIDECSGVHPTVVGTAANDELLGTKGSDVIHGGGGDDTLRGKSGDDILCGGPGNDFMHTGPGDDIAYGGTGQDHLLGRAGMDALYGEVDEDLIRGGSGDDAVSGGNGDDVIHGNGGSDRVDGNEGSDTIYGGSDDDALQGGRGDDTIYGAGGDDFINGGAGDDEVRGQSGDDEVRGGAGHDQVSGGTGTDTVYGGTGTDTCTGGEIGFSGCETIV